MPVTRGSDMDARMRLFRFRHYRSAWRAAAYRNTPAFFLHHFVEEGSIGAGEADAAMRGGFPKLAYRSRAVNCIAASKENRVRHRRIMILFRIVHAHQTLGR